MLQGKVKFGVVESGIYSIYSIIKDVVSLLDNRKDNYGLTSNQITQGIMGAGAEGAVHKRMGLYFPFPINVFKSQPDCIPLSADIRWTGSQAIIIRPGDADRWMIGVSGGPREWTIHGAINVVDVKKLPKDSQHFWYAPDKSRPGCWNIPFKYFREIGDVSYLNEREFRQ
jgi:hypothetical protein